LDNSGLLYFGVEDDAKYQIHTTQSFNDDHWHLATATLSASGIKLYVDGKIKSQQSTPTKGKAYSGYWKIGYGDLSGWTGNPGNLYFKGIVDDISIYSKELSSNEIEILYEKQYLNIYCQNDVICSSSGSSSIIIENSEPGVKYQLFNNLTNNPIGSAVEGNAGTVSLPTGTLNQSTQIKIKAVNNNTLCEKQLDSIYTIVVNSSVSPQVYISSNASLGSHCKGDTLIFNSSALYGGSSPIYNWLVNGVSVGNNENHFKSRNLNNGDQLSLQMTSSLACASPKTVSSNIITTSISEIPDNTITLEGKSQFCEGDKVSLSGVSSDIMKWYKIGSGIVSTSNPLVINETGEYYLYVENDNGCWSVSDTIKLEKNELTFIDLGQDKSIYTNESIELDAGNANSYLWSTGDDTRTITVNGNIGIGNHTYSVEISNENGCKNSDTIQVEVISVLGFDENNQKLKTIVFPNPSSDFLYIEFDEGILGRITLELINTRGQKVLTKDCSIHLRGQREKLDLSGLAKGAYYLKVNMDSQVAFYKIIIN
jgi:hypothetical protein